MPRRALKHGMIYCVLALAMSSAVVVSTVLAQAPMEQAGNLTVVAKEWGIFAAVAVGLVAYSVWQQNVLNRFQRDTLVRLVENNQAFIIAATDAIKGSPCGSGFSSSEIRKAMMYLKAKQIKSGQDIEERKDETNERRHE